MNMNDASMTHDASVFDRGPTEVEQATHLDLQFLGKFLGDGRLVTTGRVGEKAKRGVGQSAVRLKRWPRVRVVLDRCLCVPAHGRKRTPGRPFDGRGKGTRGPNAVEEAVPSVSVNAMASAATSARKPASSKMG